MFNHKVNILKVHPVYSRDGIFNGSHPDGVVWSLAGPLIEDWGGKAD